MPGYWIGVASREHVLKGVAGGFAILNHGKRPPLERLMPGDWLIYYSPKTAMEGQPLQAFTAIGRIADHAPYQAEMAPGMTGWRRDVDWQEANEAPIAALTERLAFAQGNWGMLARRGLFPITKDDFAVIHDAMRGTRER